MLDSFNQTSLVQPLLGVSLPVTQAVAPGVLNAAQLIGGATPMKPVGVFNRFDLAPKDGSNCGEYRIVYSMMNGPGRFLLIFESRLPNPNPAAGLAGCLPIAKMWEQLSTMPDDATRVAKLREFYYTNALGFGPVVDYQNYGMPMGQVRSNLLISSPWILREHRTAQEPITNAVVFKTDTVKESPIPEFFRDPTTLPSVISTAQQSAYRSDFLDKPVCNLTAPDRSIATPSQDDIVNGIGPGFLAAGDDMESISQTSAPPQDDDLSHALDPSFVTPLTARLGALGLTAKVTSTQLMNRAGAMTCGGCHQFSNGAALDNAAHTWPPARALSISPTVEIFRTR
mgnify:CR=1 FL=1